MTTDPLNAVEFEKNPEPRCPVVLLLDTSGSMDGQPIDELNQGLREFAQSLQSDPLASLRVEAAIVTFGDTPKVVDARADRTAPFDENEPFVTVDEFQAPILPAAGLTPMCAAIRMAIDLLRRRKDTYKRNGIDYYRPWILLLTDGQPTDPQDLPATAAAIQQEEASKSLILFAIGSENADMGMLAGLSAQRQPVKMRGLQYRELFLWLSKSLQGVSASQMGQQVSLPPIGWSSVDTATPSAH